MKIRSVLLTPELLLQLYRQGMFPMAEGDVLFAHDPDPRAIFPLEKLRPNARLRRHLRKSGFSFTQDRVFEQVMRACADRPERWISEEMVQGYTALHRMGNARSVETWREGDLVGGIYGVQIGRAFFGESMFSRQPFASTGAFHHLADVLRSEGYRLFDTQYANAHTVSLGAIEVPRTEFHGLLRAALG